MGAALNDLAYAVNDTIKDPANFKALNVLIQEMINNAVMQALNNTFGTEGASPLNVLIGNGNADVKNAITALANGGGVPIVRKIQRGIIELIKLESEGGTSVTLSGFTNLSKMIVILNGISGRYEDDTIAFSYTPYILSLTKTKLTVASFANSRNTSEGKVSYQVIELW